MVEDIAVDMAAGAFWSNGYATLYRCDSRRLPLEDASVNLVCTSPPYWGGLRDYKLEPLVWGGEPGCTHAWGAFGAEHHKGQVPQTKWQTNSAVAEGQNAGSGQSCLLCPAWLGSLGAEPTPEAYIAHLLDVFREVWRVMRPDACLFLNMGDSMDGLAEVGMPHKVKDALVAEGWLCRQTIVWEKPSVMPESVSGWRWEQCRVKVAPWSHEAQDGKLYRGENKSQGWSPKHDGTSTAEWRNCPGCAKCSDNDGLVLRRGNWRPTGSHEYIYMLTKGPGYYGDAEAVKEGKAPATVGDPRDNEDGHRRDRGYMGAPSMGGTNLGGSQGGRNLRSVWRFSPEPLTGRFAGSHFAAFPSALPERCILAGTSEKGVCSDCSAPWARIVQREEPETRAVDSTYCSQANEQPHGVLSTARVDAYPPTQTLGWRATCRCQDAGDPVPATVLDIFSGSGSTLIAAQRLGRRSVGCDLNLDYLALAQARLEMIPIPMGI